MLSPGALNSSFATYWSELDRCRAAGAYWALLHLTVCLPDVCAALQSDDGESAGRLYSEWCDKYVSHAMLSGGERWRMRCKVLHQGRATTDVINGRYVGFSFGQPSVDGHVDHMRVDGTALNLDVGHFYAETRAGVERWIQAVEATPGNTVALNVERHLGSLVRVRSLPFPTQAPASPGSPSLVTTLKTS